MFGPADCANWKQVNRDNKAREKALCPKGIPRYIRCYALSEESKIADRFTVVFTRRCDETVGPFGQIQRSYPYIGMSAHPWHPQGVGMHGETKDHPVDRPTAGHLGKKIPFKALPIDCQQIVLNDYRELWGIE